MLKIPLMSCQAARDFFNCPSEMVLKVAPGPKGRMHLSWKCIMHISGGGVGAGGGAGKRGCRDNQSCSLLQISQAPASHDVLQKHMLPFRCLWLWHFFVCRLNNLFAWRVFFWFCCVFEDWRTFFLHGRGGVLKANHKIWSFHQISSAGKAKEK